eukprot:TRINITY_DN1951_c0_g3_i1.p1 TRINITY_DN1951_c0_g3~~TRINITY_DN1951_c0_g3_i1.p1  ORF type:complete len:156 (+),score=17.48 TRINITY_DN1951_c0_g3_i1:39-470(+)
MLRRTVFKRCGEEASKKNQIWSQIGAKLELKTFGGNWQPVIVTSNGEYGEPVEVRADSLNGTIMTIPNPHTSLRSRGTEKFYEKSSKVRQLATHLPLTLFWLLAALGPAMIFAFELSVTNDHSKVLDCARSAKKIEGYYPDER